MTYNHDKAKTMCPDCAREVERLRAEVERLEDDCTYFETSLRLAEKHLKEFRAKSGGLEF